MYSNGRILVFAKTPRRGGVKTRLQSVLGEEGCYQLHQILVKNTVEMALDSKVAPVEVWNTGDSEHLFWQQLIESHDLTLSQQQGDDLGERMFQAFSIALKSMDWVIIIGADCPEIDTAYLEEAASVLDSGASAVIGPAEDGGYVLIGLREPLPFLFSGISWGANSVLDETLFNAQKNNCDIHLMRPLRDLDEESDLRYFAGTITLFSGKLH